MYFLMFRLVLGHLYLWKDVLWKIKISPELNFTAELVGLVILVDEA